jgi:serine/threonine-protein phosphatase 2B catalytic subunit
MVSMLDELTPRLENEKDFGLLFLGDYVDRGIKGVEVLLYLMALKIVYPKKITLLRGNHESKSMTEAFSFRDEVIQKYDEETYEAFLELFNSLPLVGVVNGLYLCMHGGISPDLYEINDINTRIDRF